MKRRIFKKNLMLAQKTGLAAVVFALTISLCLMLAANLSFFFSQKSQYEERAHGYAQMLADYVDGDTVEGYLSTLKKDAYYDEVQDFMDRMKEGTELHYIAVVDIELDVTTYVWLSTIDEETDEDMLGVREETGMDEAEMKKIERSLLRRKMYIYSYYGVLVGEVYMPIEDSSGNVVAISMVGMALKPIISTLIRNSILMTLAGILVALAIAYGMYLREKRRIVDPIKTINAAVDSMIEHIKDDELITVECETGDEIEELALDFMFMANKMRAYIREIETITAEKERVTAELNVATKIQASMLPLDFPCTEYYELCASMTPAKEVGGDFYDFFMIDRTHVAIVVADVSGKGVPAALFMVIAKTLLKYQSVSLKDPGVIFRDANDALCESNGEGMFVTAFEGVLDLVTGELTFVNAGHEPPFIKRAGGEFEMKKLKPALVLAVMEGMKYETGSIMLEPGDRIFQYTDGATEATNAKNELFEFDRLRDALNRHKKESAPELLKSIEKEINEFAGDAPQFDDLTMLCLDFKKRMEPSEDEEHKG